MGLGVLSANKEVDVIREASALAVDIFIKLRRSIQAYSACKASVPDAVVVSQHGAKLELSEIDGSPKAERVGARESNALLWKS